jgi:hypothetical protein
MLITFRTKAAGPITMFGDSAIALLKAMGQTGEVPGGIKAADIGAALGRLRAALGKAPKPAAPVDDVDAAGNRIELPVTLARRAVPLVEMLERADKAKTDVMWTEGA